MKKYKIIDLLILIITFLLTFLMYTGITLNNTFLALYLIFINVYMCIKFRKNNKLCVLFIILFYFNYSFVISRYIGLPTKTVADLYNYIYYQNTHVKGLIFIIIMFTVINQFFDFQNESIDKNIDYMNFKYRKLLIYFMQFGLVAVLIHHFINKIPANGTTILEYSIILFIFIFMLSKNDKKNKVITEIIMLFYILYSFKGGQRIAVLQFLLADFFINYTEKLKIKQIIIFIIIGLFAFTFEGIYGDMLLSNNNFTNLNTKYVLKKFSERRFALDTSVSSYYTYLSVIETTPKFSLKERIKDGINFNILYPLLGHKYYPALDYKVKVYKPNWGGGFPTGYYYYYFDLFGVLLISCYIGKLIKMGLNKSSIYSIYLFIYILSTSPRWYLYEPTILIRGLLIFNILYLIIKFAFMRRKNNDFKK